jgi:hypothetical protein
MNGTVKELEEEEEEDEEKPLPAVAACNVTTRCIHHSAAPREIVCMHLALAMNTTSTSFTSGRLDQTRLEA